MIRRKALNVEGHRGAITNAHENSMEAFLEAERLEIDGIEFDLWLTSDHVPVISHAKTKGGLEVLLSTITNKLDYVFLPLISSENLKNYVYPNTHTKIPTFQEMLLALKDSRLYLNVELKESRPELAEAVIKIIQKVKPSAKIIFSSFYFSLRPIIDDLCHKNGLPRYPFGYLVGPENDFPPLDELAGTIMPREDSINIDVQFVLLKSEQVRQYIEKAIAIGLVIKCYNLIVLSEFEDHDLFDTLVEFGVETFICNRVEKLLHYNKSKSL